MKNIETTIKCCKNIYIPVINCKCLKIYEILKKIENFEKSKLHNDFIKFFYNDKIIIT